MILSVTSLTALAAGYMGCSSDSTTGTQSGTGGSGGNGGASTTGTSGSGGGAGATGGTGATAGKGGSGTTGGASGSSGSGGASTTGTGGAGTTGTGGASGSAGVGGSAGKAGSGGAPPDGGRGGSGGATDAGAKGDAGGGGAGAGGSPQGGACVGDYVPGDYPPGVEDANAWLEISGVTGQPAPRHYKVHVPPSYDCRVPTPLLFCIHGFQQTGIMFCVQGSAGKTSGPKGFVDKSNEEGFILVIPTGSKTPGMDSAWNGGSCCGGKTTDDVALFRALVTEVSKHVNVDAKRVYAAGLSNGALMSYRLACEAADVFTAVAPGAGQIGVSSCKPSRPVSVLDIHGTADSYFPFSSQATSTATMATGNGCGTATTPATVPGSGGDTTCVTRSGCPNGIEITACKVEAGGHVWFGDPTCGTSSSTGCAQVGANSNFFNNTDAAWDFFKRLSR